MLLLGCLLVSCALVQDAPRTTDGEVRKGPLGESIASFVEAAEAVGFSDCVLTARVGEVVACVAAGPLQHGSPARLKTTTLFEIASATKPFTALAIVRLEQREKLSLDDPMGKHLPSVPEDSAAITLAHLIQHTSGIPGTNSVGRGEAIGPFLRSVLAGGPRHAPGTHFEYWNQGYALLSEVIARASGESYVAHLRTDLFEPAGMKHTCFTGDKAPRDVTVAVGRSLRGAARSALEHPYGAYGLQYRGMGGIVTSVWDLWRFDRALAAGTLLDAEDSRRVFTPGLGGYALGWRVARGSRNRLVQSHSGGVRGFVCDVQRFPEEDGCLFVLCNDDGAPLHPVANAVEALLFGDEPRPHTPPAALDPTRRKAIIGKYENEQGRTLTVAEDGSVTTARIDWAPPNGPVTRATLGLDAKDGIVLYEWTDVTPLEVRGHGAQTTIVIGSDVYTRR